MTLQMAHDILLPISALVTIVRYMWEAASYHP